MKLKMRLTPYIYAYCREAYDTGVPAVRAMVLEYPDDPVTWSKRTQYQFMSGESLLVAPVYEDSPVRNDIYLPAGKWIDYWNGQEYFGPTVLNSFETPLEKLPVFVKAGAIIPMYPEMLYDREKPKDPLTFDVYPSGKSSFTLYEDDGLTQDYRAGMYTRTLVEVDAPKIIDAPVPPAAAAAAAPASATAVAVATTAATAKPAPAKKTATTAASAGPQIVVKVGPAKGKYRDMPAARSYIVDVHLPVRPAGVKLNDKALPGLAKKEEFDKVAEGWFFDARDRRGVLHVKTKSLPLASGFTVRIGL
jgi:alpha-glucosidase